MAYNNLGLLYLVKGEPSKAKRLVDTAIEIDPSLTCALSNRGKVTALLRQHQSHQPQHRERAWRAAVEQRRE